MTLDPTRPEANMWPEDPDAWLQRPVLARSIPGPCGAG